MSTLNQTPHIALVEMTLSFTKNVQRKIRAIAYAYTQKNNLRCTEPLINLSKIKTQIRWAAQNDAIDLLHPVVSGQKLGVGIVVG